MKKNNELIIDGYSIYIDQLEQMDEQHITHDGNGTKNKALEWATQNLEQAMKPVICIMDSLRNAAKEATPDEIELAMQFEINLKGETPVLKIVSAETSAQIAVTFTWKNTD